MAVEKDIALTTFDNPWDPFTQYTEWFLYDVEKGHYTCAMIARFAHVSDEMSDEEEAEENERAIDEIIRYDFQNKYKKVVRGAQKNAFRQGEGV